MKKIAVSVWLFMGLFAFSLFSENSLGGDLSEGVSIPEGGDLQYTPSNGPFFYSAEKDGNHLFILGTIHFGFSLNDLICSEEITERIKSGDLVFVENRIAAMNLDPADTKTLRTASKAERQKTLSKLSPEDRNIYEEIEKQKVSVKNTLSSFFVSNSDDNFEDLSQETRDLLISLGADEEGNYIDYFALLQQGASATAILPYIHKFMDREVARRAVSEGVELKILDDLTLTLFQLMGTSQKKFKQTMESPENTQKILIDRPTLENFAETGYNQIIQWRRAMLLAAVEAYGRGDEEEVRAMTLLSATAEQHLLKERNQLWWNKLKTALEGKKNSRIFLAAGVHHIIGNHNLLDMLQEEGFHIRRMEADCSLTPPPAGL